MIVKVCGMRDAQNIRAVEQLDVDWMGFICAPQSPRYVSQRPAFLPSKAQRIGVFVNASEQEIQEKVEQLGLNILQLHGQETPSYCEHIHHLTGLPILKAIAIQSEEDFQQALPYQNLPCVQAFVFDTKCSTGGGSGTKFDWHILDAYQGAKPFLLAGGIAPEDATDLLVINHHQLLGVDLNSRFECAPAMKDVERLKYFINQLSPKR